MKKQLISAFLILVLMITAAMPAVAETFTAKGAFTLKLPAGWEADTSYNEAYSDPSEKYYYLGILFNDDAVIEMDIAFDEAYKGESLSQMSRDELADYQDALKDWLEDGGDYKAAYVGTYEVGDHQIPFMIFKTTSKRYGDSYYAEAMSGGWCISFEYYMYYEDDALTQAGLDELLDVLSAFSPIL